MSEPPETDSLASRVIATAARFPDRPAVHVAGSSLTYRQLERRAAGVAELLLERDPGAGDPPLTGVFGGGSAATYTAILGILLRGHGYVPLNPRFPALRNRDVLERSRCRVVLVDSPHLEEAQAIVDELADPPALVSIPEDEARGELELPLGDPDTPAYLLFTSGSTGRPKGVLVRQKNVLSFLDAIAERYQVAADDRLSQLFDLTFDLSAFDLFVAWQSGACVCCPDAWQRLRPVDFVRDSSLTLWFSVPSAAMFIERLGGLKPGMFPTLRLSLFCGEALTAELADAWAAAAPNSVVENLYGPTEATIACTVHTWPAGTPAGANGFVPIGEPFGETEAHVVGEELEEMNAGEPGQLLLTGAQVAEGYWEDPETTSRSFVTFGDTRGYLTGDRVVRAHDGAPLEYLGRIDSQIKVLGHRVELEEIEAVLREEAHADALAVGWPLTPSGAAGIVAFVASPSLDAVELRRALSQRLPDYMVPRELRPVAELPLNSNGKRDRKAVLAILESE